MSRYTLLPLPGPTSPQTTVTDWQVTPFKGPEIEAGLGHDTVFRAICGPDVETVRSGNNVTDYRPAPRLKLVGELPVNSLETSAPPFKELIRDLGRYSDLFVSNLFDGENPLPHGVWVIWKFDDAPVAGKTIPNETASRLEWALPLTNFSNRKNLLFTFMVNRENRTFRFALDGPVFVDLVSRCVAEANSLAADMRAANPPK